MRITPGTTIRDLQVLGSPLTLLPISNEPMIFDGTVKHLVRLVCSNGAVYTTPRILVGDCVPAEDCETLCVGTGLVADNTLFIVSKDCLTGADGQTVPFSEIPFSAAKVVFLP